MTNYKYNVRCRECGAGFTPDSTMEAKNKLCNKCMIKRMKNYKKKAY